LPKLKEALLSELGRILYPELDKGSLPTNPSSCLNPDIDVAFFLSTSVRSTTSPIPGSDLLLTGNRT